jgi:hypothetical protein
MNGEVVRQLRLCETIPDVVAVGPTSLCGILVRLRMDLRSLDRDVVG